MEQNQEKQIRIEPFTLIKDIARNWLFIILGALAAALIVHTAAGMTYTPRYTSSATFVVSQKKNATSWSNMTAAYDMAKTFKTIVESNIMKKAIAEDLGHPVTAKVETNVIGETNLMVMRVTDSSPREAIDTIRSIMAHYQDVSFYSLGSAVMNVIEEPSIPTRPDNPIDARDRARKAGLIGALIVAVLFGICSYLNDTIKQEEDIELKLDARKMGVIPYELKKSGGKGIKRLKKNRKSLLITDPLSGFRFVEAYRKLATRVAYRFERGEADAATTGRNGKVIVVTSVSENEGKSTVAANLAIALAEKGKKVLLMEGDLRRPAQFLICEERDLDSTHEIGEFLLGNTQLKDVLLKSRKVENLYLMLGRNCYNSTSTEMVGSARMEKLLGVCRNAMDYVVIDTPPAGLMGDAEAIAGVSDGVLLVVKQNYMKAGAVNDVLDAFREHHCTVLGVVLNHVQSLLGFSSDGYGFYGSAGSYGKYGNYGKYGKYGQYGKAGSYNIETIEEETL